ncbi:MAG: hypothetical protein ABIS67_15885 [Candidatus Eisenbacteria bacterium]
MQENSRFASTRHLLELCVGYYLSYVLTGIAVKVFTGGIREPRMSDMAFLFNNTIGGNGLALGAVIAMGWLTLKGARTIRLGGLNLPAETAYIIPSGICTAIIIPGTTLLYTLPISVMVAMVIMRASVIVISRAVDAIQIRQGLLKRQVLPEENWAVVFALLALGTNLMLIPLVDMLDARGVPVSQTFGMKPGALSGGFEFIHSPLAMTVLIAYIIAYAVRLYIMNYFKNTRGPGQTLDNRGFFAIEQVAATAGILFMGVLVYVGRDAFGWSAPAVIAFHQAAGRLDLAAILSGIPFGLVAFFSVFLFMFQGRTATFAGVVNRLTSLLAGTTATLLLAWIWKQRPPSIQDWASLGFILIAVGFLTRAERRRSAEATKKAPAPAGVAKPVITG